MGSKYFLKASRSFINMADNKFGSLKWRSNAWLPSNHKSNNKANIFFNSQYALVFFELTGNIPESIDNMLEYVDNALEYVDNGSEYVDNALEYVMWCFSNWVNN